MIELGLQRMSRLLATTPLPWCPIHVAGTNGKGSICAYVSGMLEAYNQSKWRSVNRHSSLRHGRFVSPHLIDRWDCITIDQETVRPSIFKEIEQAVLERNERQQIEATEFEILTATAFEIFAREKIDVGVVEVGMGGRLDATNIIGRTEGLEPPSAYPDASTLRLKPLVTAISSIGLDHQAFLGNTLEEIAREKAGIIKSGVPVVYDTSNNSKVIDVLRSVAQQHNSKTIAANEDCISPVLEHANKTTETSDDLDHYNRLPSYMKRNCQVAFAATLSALQQLVPASRSDLSKDKDLMSDLFATIRTSSMPGRQQFLTIERLTGRKEDIVLDGAHNAQSAEMLSKTVQKLRQQAQINGSAKAVTWVLAASDTKDVRGIFAPLIAAGDSVYAVEFGPVDGMPWVKPMAAAEILAAASDVVNQHDAMTAWDYGADVLGALRAASEQAAGGPMVVAGSLYLVGNVLRLLRDT